MAEIQGRGWNVKISREEYEARVAACAMAMVLQEPCSVRSKVISPKNVLYKAFTSADWKGATKEYWALTKAAGISAALGERYLRRFGPKEGGGP